MEGADSLFSGLSDTLKTNFVPIAVVLALVLLVVGWLVYKSVSSSSKNDDSEPDTEQSEAEDNSQQPTEQKEQFVDDENTPSE
jgi:hypothetical protein